MKVLWILPKWPYPDNDGAKRAHMALLKNWPKEYPLDLVIFTNELKTEEDKKTLQKLIGFNKLLILPCSKWPNAIQFCLSLFSSSVLPTTVRRFANKQAIASWNEWSEELQWDILVIDVLHPFGLFANPAKKMTLPKVKAVCFRAHNVESELWEQAQDGAPFFKKWVYKKEKVRMLAFEKSVISESDILIPVSDVDACKFNLLNDTVITEALPIGMEWLRNPSPIPSSKNIELLFIGRMDWLPNYQGLCWFLDEVWPNISSSNNIVTLHVVGSHASKNLTKRLKNTCGIIYHGQVPNVEPYYDKIAMTIIPILIGSGTRVKAIESAQYGRSFVSTGKGVEGITLSPGVDFIEANSKEEWISALNALTKDKCTNLGQNIFNHLKKKYDKEIIQKNFISLLKTLATK